MKDSTLITVIPLKKQSGAFTIFDMLRLLVHIICGLAGLTVGFNTYDLTGGILGLIAGLTVLGWVAYRVITFLMALILKVIFGGPFFRPKSD